jgi:hypothetical protein
LCYIKKKVTDFNRKLEATVDDAVRELGINKCGVKIRLDEKETQCQGWLDSKGQQLMGLFQTTQGHGDNRHQQTYPAPAGPPTGYNLVLIGAPVDKDGVIDIDIGLDKSTGRAALPWPPGSAEVATQLAMQPGMLAPDMSAPARGG